MVEEAPKRQRLAPSDRFQLAAGRRFRGLGREEHGGSAKPFFFVQMADTQLGMEASFLGKKAATHGWSTELALTKRAAEEVNRLRPAFAIVCGDLADEYPEGETGRAVASDELRERQVRDFKATMSLIDPEIPLVCLCGNHDIGDRPNAVTIKKFTDMFGDDYFSFWCHGVKCLILNSQLWKDDADAKNLREAMDRWLDEELQELQEINDVGEATDVDKATLKAAPRCRVLAFSHVPPFVFSPDEADEYFNLNYDLRQPILKRLARHGCTGWFCGHYHRNAGGVYRDKEGNELEVVVTAAVGTQITDKPGGDPLGKSGIGGHKIGEIESGLRLVRVWPDRVEHEWKNFQDLAEVQPESIMGELSL